MERKVLGKRPLEKYLALDEDDKKTYSFKILLPNGTSVSLELRRSSDEIEIHEFVEEIKQEYFRTVGARIVKGRRKIMWREPTIHLEDLSGIKITKIVALKCFATNTCHYLKLLDGVNATSDSFQNMWDLTPDTDMLIELPEDYTFETALADLIDNSLQAVWSNGRDDLKLVSVTAEENRLSIFDTGPGMDGNGKNSIVKWGKIGASHHRSAKHRAIGGRPPYLTPFFGMFGYGGVKASMHLGRHALVSSKTKDSKKVYTLHLEREALLKSGEKTWKTDGGIRDPLEDEVSASPHGSFTKVEIFELKLRLPSTAQLKSRLKDIYFPYIQCDEMLHTGRTATPIQFQVNGENLAELEGGEVAITNMLSCNGPEFVLELHFLVIQDTTTVRNPGSRASQEAHARLKCVYFPIVEGKESIDVILEKLKEEGSKVTENFDTFSRASIRRLGRLLPDARWGRLPFMEPKQRKGERTQVLKRCCMRVKCFIDTDAGFNPTPSKTDLALHHPCTVALKSFGHKSPGKEMDASVEILRDGKTLSHSQLEKEYEAWVFQMHDRYDEEIVCGEDEPVVVFLSPDDKKGLGVSSNVVRVHKVIKRKGEKWESGCSIKILKGAAGCYKNHIYATLEYILLEGLEGDPCGDARLICRPLDVPTGKSCLLKIDETNTSFNIRGSLSFPLSVIDSGKCKLMDVTERKSQLEKLKMKSPSTIDILSAQECQKLDIDGVLDFDAPVKTDFVNFKNIIAVLRPVCYDSYSSRSLDQKFIVKDDLEMSMAVTYLGEDDGQHGSKHYSARVSSVSRRGIHGLYIFSFGSRDTKLFQKPGIYKFLFNVNCEDSSSKKCEKRLTILPDLQVGQWKVLSDEKCPTFQVRVGSSLPCIPVACLNAHGERIPFLSVPEVVVKVESGERVICNVNRTKVDLNLNKMGFNISNICIESSKLDSIQPHYETTLVICSRDDSYSVRLPLKVMPGPLYKINAECMEFEKQLLPGSVIKKLVLEILDRFGNHVERGFEVSFSADGLCSQDQKGLVREVDQSGCIDLSGVLKVSAGYGKIVSLSVVNGKKICFRKEFQVEKRMLKIVSEVPLRCAVGSQLENITFEIVDSEGAVDDSIHHLKFGKSHTLMITSKFPELDDSLHYSFFHGRCTVPSIPIPREEGVYSILVAHSDHPEICTNIQIQVVRPPKSLSISYEHRDALTPCSNRGMLLLQGPSIGLSEDDETFTESIMNFSQGPSIGHLGNKETLVESIMNGSQELENDFSQAALRVGEHERKLELLSEKKKIIEQGICHLEALSEPISVSPLDCFMYEKEVIERRIYGKQDTAASVICNLLKYSRTHKPQLQLMQEIFGVVALLGTVSNDNISRIFAEYLGEDNMLAVVCKSYSTASNLEDEHEELGLSISRRFLVICLEEISPYIGKIESSDSQRKLALPNPLLSSGKPPPGFLGYAVNMVNIDSNIRTSKDHGLRETLFYLLFGELQVYETRDYMKRARTAIKHGAVSLDGGIMKANGFLSLGACVPEICFPVEPEVERQHSPQTVNILREVVQKKLDLEATSDEIEKESKALVVDIKEFQLKRDQYYNFINSKQPMVDKLRPYNKNVSVKTEAKEFI